MIYVNKTLVQSRWMLTFISKVKEKSYQLYWKDIDNSSGYSAVLQGYTAK